MKKFISALLALAILPVLPVSAADADAPSRLVADYSGAGTVVAVVATGFDTKNPAFGETPPAPALNSTIVDHIMNGAYMSEKLPAVWDFADNDPDVSTTSIVGTAMASLAAGRYTGAGDTIQEDGTVIHENSFAGAAADAQLLLFKAASDEAASRMDAAATAAAIRTAVALRADAIVLYTNALTMTDDLSRAIDLARVTNTPILVGAGDRELVYSAENLPATYVDSGTITDWAGVDGMYAVGAATDSFSDVAEFYVRREDAEKDAEQLKIPYSDSCTEYFGDPFAALMHGVEARFVRVPGFGQAEDYDGLDVSGAVAVIDRGEISFADKAKNAAEAGAVAMVVIDSGDGLSRMSLEGAPIPGVMIEKEDGEALLSAIDASLSTLVIVADPAGAASFSADGVTENLSGSIALLAQGQRVTAAIPRSDALDGANFARVSGTAYAAATAAGLLCRAVEYSRAAEIDRALAMNVLASTAQAVPDAADGALSPRMVGVGIVGTTGAYATTILSGENFAVVSLDNTTTGTSTIDIRLTNTGKTEKHYAFHLDASIDAVETDENGVARRTGMRTPLSGVRAYLGDSSYNIASDGAQLGVTLSPGESFVVPIHITLTQALQREVLSVFWYGFFLDSVVTITDLDTDETAATHQLSSFFGEWESAPLADVSVFDEGEATIVPSYLAVRTFTTDSSYAVRLGATDPTSVESAYDQAYNLVNPLALRYGWVEIALTALRPIDQIDIRFYDENRHEVFSQVVTDVEKALIDGRTIIPLWDFIAADNDEYLFPDGEYTCEIRLSASFGRGMDAVQFMGFSFIADSVAPTISDYTLTRAGDKLYLDVTAEDDRALREITVYDTAFTFPLEEDGFDVTQYDGASPLYIEATDFAGNYTVVRITEVEFEALLAALPEDEATEETEETDEIESEEIAA